MRPFLLYTGGLSGLFAGSWLAAWLAFEVLVRFAESTSPHWSWSPLWNEFAPLLSGIPIALFLVWLLERGTDYRPTLIGHVRRAASWYGFIALVLIVSYLERDNPDFGLWSQAITWPMMSTIGAVGTDLLVTWKKSRRAGT